jgi:hypothetical protein
MKIRNKIIALMISLIAMPTFAIAQQIKPYVFLDYKRFSYGITTDDLQAINRSLISLGYSSSLSSTDNSGNGFEIGGGADIHKNFGLEASYVNLGTLTINTTLTGPSESLKTEIDGTSFAVALVVKGGDDKNTFYGRVGMHTWDLDGKVTGTRGAATASLGDGTDPFFGVGYKFGDLVRIGYDYYKIDDGDIKSFNIGLNYKF